MQQGLWNLGSPAIVLDEAEFQPVEVEDCTLTNLPCVQKICVCNSGNFGSITENKQLEMVHLFLAEFDNFKEKSAVFEKFCEFIASA